VESLGNFTDPFLPEIAGQPDALRSAAAALVDQADELDRIRRAAEAADNLVFTGMGASYDACYPAVNELAGRGIPALLVDTAELLYFRRRILTTTTLLTIVSQSGRSAEVVRLAGEIGTQAGRPFVLTVTNGLDNPLAELADVTLDTTAGEETGPSTITFVAALVQLACVAWLLGGDPVDTALDRTRSAVAEGARGIERMLRNPHGWADELDRSLVDHDLIVIVGRGPARAAAEMGALLLKESGVMAEAFESAAFRHGPFELAGAGMAAIVVATEPETRDLDLGLARDLVDAGASVLVISTDGVAPEGAHALAIGAHDRALASAVSIVPVQLLAWRLSADRGRTPGAFTRALKVTTRE
jgi:glucosamine--fructose-6-phosphate aminotransferase (isomerizing)